jgi:PKD repeat protein
LSCLAAAAAGTGCGQDEDHGAGEPGLSTTQQGLTAAGAVLTQHVDPARTGLNAAETQLSWASVPGNFARLFSIAVDGRLFAQPLYAPQVATASGTRDLVILATEANTVYGVDGHTGAVVWQRNLGTPIPSLDAYPSLCVNIPGGIGITGTPVIDPATGTIYLVSATKDISGYHQKLHALDVATGSQRTGSPSEIAAQVFGDGPAAPGGVISFEPLRANQRAGLLLLGSKVYVAWASHCDDAINPHDFGVPARFFGWVMSFDATTLVRTGLFNTAPHANLNHPNDPYGAAIWQGGGGLATDGTRIFANTGNGLYEPASGDWGDSTLAFTPDLTRVDSFTPADEDTLDAFDIDMSAGGIVVVPTGVPQHPHLLVTSGKEGTVYVLDRDHLGGAQLTGADTICPPNQAPGNCVVGRGGQVVGGTTNAGAFFGLPAYFNGRVYFAGNTDRLKAFSVGGSSALSGVLAQTTMAFGYPGATPSISANGTSDGIVWAIERTATDPSASPSVRLHAFRADNLAELYNSHATGEDPVTASQFITPTIAGGQVMLGAGTQLVVYGTVLRPSPASQQVLQGAATSFTVASPVMSPAPSIALAVTGLPAGATAAFSPGVIAAGASSTLAVTAGAATPPGTYALTITGTSGALTRTTSVALTVVHRDLPPTAVIQFSCNGRLCSFDGTHSSDPEGPITAYRWGFGDSGLQITLPTTSHLYQAPGTYNVTLTVTDSAGQTNVATQQITVVDALPTARFTASCAIWQCRFDASASSDAEGAIASYAWNFGDGSPTASGVNPGHSYAANGTFTVTLTVTDSAGQTAQVAHTVVALDQPPHAVFSTVCTDLTCAAESEGSSDDVAIASYRWDWGDGAVTSGGSPASAPTHTYAAYGSYTIALSAIDTVGQVGTASQTVTLAPGPTAAFTFSCSGLTCQFDASGSSSPAGGLHYHWDWDDETTSDPPGPLTSHTYAFAALFSVHLTVTDANNRSAGISRRVFINAAISPPGTIDPPPPPPPQKSVRRAPR